MLLLVCSLGLVVSQNLQNHRGNSGDEPGEIIIIENIRIHSSKNK